jgi:hypothetical protein
MIRPSGYQAISSNLEEAAYQSPVAITTKVSPVVEVVEALLREELGGPVVEVRIEFMNDAFEPQDREETSRKGCGEITTKKSVKKRPKQQTKRTHIKSRRARECQASPNSLASQSLAGTTTVSRQCSFSGFSRFLLTEIFN